MRSPPGPLHLGRSILGTTPTARNITESFCGLEGEVRRRDPRGREGREGGEGQRGGHRRVVLLPSLVHGGPARPGPRAADERGGADQQLPPVAARVLGAVFLGRVLAGISEDRLPARDSLVPDAAAPVRR